jgi:Na+/proline symporter
MGLGIVVTSVLVVWNLNWTDLNKALVRAQKSGIVFQEGQKPREAREKEEQASIRNTQGQQAADDLAKQQREQYGQWLKANSANLSQQDVLVSTKKNEPVKAMTMADPYDPFASNGVAWVVWQTILGLAVVTTWQTTIARVLAARDSRSARLIYRRTAFYWVGRFGLPGLWGAAAFVFFTAHGGLPEEGLHSLTAMPRFLKEIMPMGVIGIMIAAMLAAEMSTDSGYLLTWATVIYNDLVCPVLRQPLSPAGRLVVIRAMVLAIGVFLIFYGLWYELPGGAWDYLAVTGNIYLASLFTLLVGGLYWRKANSWGATAAIVLGAIGPLSFLVTNALVPRDPPLVPAAVAGLASFAMSFAGMIFGSLAANYLGKGFCGTVKVASEGGS